MRLLTTTSILLVIGLAKAVYVPGTPGAKWTDEELVVTKGKLIWIMNNRHRSIELVPGGFEICQEYFKLDRPRHAIDAIMPNMPKMVRLAFHDCIPQTNGEGCNGCLNMKGVGLRYEYWDCAPNCPEHHPKHGPFKTDNNNLYWVALVLEYLYKNATFGPGHYPQHLSESLYATGKSRADLWAFAGLVALQMGAHTNHGRCDPRNECNLNINGSIVQCGYDYDHTEFTYGRADCTTVCSPDEPFCTTEEEIHPNPQANGDETVKYFKANFNFSAKETVAIMGAHTLGHPTETNSLTFHYAWSRHAFRLDNDFYIAIVNRTNYKPMHPKYSDGRCIQSEYVGDPHGNPFGVEYTVCEERHTNAYGPFTWHAKIPDCNWKECQAIAASNASYSLNSCCTEMAYCANHGHCNWFKGCRWWDPDCKVKYKFFTTMLSADMGLYLKFDVDEEGRPRGCPSLDSSHNWLNHRDQFSKAEDCPRNDRKIEDNSGETMADLVERYAHSNPGVWINDFRKAFAKMQANGYGPGSLKANSGIWWHLRRSGRGIWYVVGK